MIPPAIGGHTLARSNRRKRRGSVVAKQTHAILKELGRGSAGQVLAKLQLLGGALPGFEDLQWVDKDMLSRLSLNKRATYIEEALALALILNVDIWYLAGLSPRRELPPEIQALRDELLK